MFLFLPVLIGCTVSSENYPSDDTGYREGPALGIPSDKIIISNVETGIRYTNHLPLRSIGSTSLIIHRIAISNAANGVFSTNDVSDWDIIIPAQTERNIRITAQTSSNEAQFGELQLQTNDPYYPDVRISLCTFPPEYSDDQSCQ